jgi:putative ABC transport system permease protein
MRFSKDIVFALRTMLRSPGLVVAGVSALGLGIGANTAIFSLADALLFKPLNIPDARGIVAVSEAAPGRTDLFGYVAPANYRDWVAESRSFTGLGAFAFQALNITSGSYPERLVGIGITDNFFRVLVAQAALGRLPAEEENKPGQDRVVVLSDRYWREHFNGNPSIVGQTIQLDLRDYTVIGVMPKSFLFPASADVWRPLAFTAREMSDRNTRSLIAVGKLAPNVTQAQATAELTSIAKRIAARYPETNQGWSIAMLSARDFMIGPTTAQYLVMLLVAVGFVLLIACANVANVVFARSLGRKKEFALRVALGAGRWQLIRQLLTETILLGGMGGVFGALAAFVETRLLVVNLPATVARYMPNWYTISVDRRALVFTAMVTLMAGLFSGILPALGCSRPDLNSTLKEGSRGSSGTHSRQRLSSLLLIGEIALSLVLLVGAGLMARGVGSLQRDTENYRPATVLTLQISLPKARYTKPEQIANFFEQLRSALNETAETSGASISQTMPYAPHPPLQPFTIQGEIADRGGPPNALIQSVSPDYFRVFNIVLLRGRLPSDDDDGHSPDVVFISDSLARRYWPNRNPLGERLRLGGFSSSEPWMEVAGVVADIKYDPLDRGVPFAAYLPYRQHVQPDAYIAIRTNDPSRLIPTMRMKIAKLDREIPLLDPKAFSEIIHERLIGLSYVAVMMSLLSVMALVMTCVGVYGLMANSVTERFREIGIRMALGAEARQVIALVLARAAVITGVGLLIGVAGSVALARLLAGLIWGINALDLSTFLVALVSFSGTAFVATCLPAYRASHVNPLLALRTD